MKRRPRILVADDQQINRALLTQFFETHLGCEVVGAADGKEALEALQQQHFDLGFLDSKMPYLSGPEVAAAVRQLPAPHGTVPLIAITANAFARDREECLAAGMDDFMRKPFSLQDLRAALKKWVGPQDDARS